MTTFKHPRGTTWRYDFWWKPPGRPASQRYTGTTGQLTKAAADRVEEQIKRRIREEAYGIAVVDRMATPSFTAFAGQHLAYLKKKGKHTRLDEVENTLRLCLQFFGKRPRPKPDKDARWSVQRAAARARETAAPYHDLRLLDPIQRPELLEAFEDWMTSLSLSGGRKNNYRSTMSALYRTALLPAFRAKTRITLNPFHHIERDVVFARDRTLTLEQLRAWMEAALPHARMAMAIAAYAPELREGTILQLQWREHLDHELTRVRIMGKTSARTGRAHVVPLPGDLRTLLAWWRAQQLEEARRKRTPAPTHVIWYRGHALQSLDVGLRAAIERANANLPEPGRLTYGAKTGVTFHTIRHTMATLLADMGVAEQIRKLVMGHESLATTQKYTHLTGAVKKRPLERLATRLQLVGAVQGRVQGPTKMGREKPRHRAASRRQS